jgi:hypothetical protein
VVVTGGVTQTVFVTNANQIDATTKVDQTGTTGTVTVTP